MPTSPRLLRFDEVMRLTGVSRPRIYALIAQGQFPQQVPLGTCSVAFVEKEVEQWIKQRIAARKPTPTT